jgi:glycopeptide antibiotics resistance protein
MREQFREYIVSLYQNIPTEVYEGLLSVFCLGLVLLLGFCGIKKGLRYTSGLLMVEYVFLIFCSTVIFRIVGETRQYDFQPFWSYQAIQEGREDLLAENIMNVVVFIPVGLLLGIAFKQVTWWKALLVGCSISVTIETLQFFLMRGFSEVDDVIHNTLGCLIGYAVARYGYERIIRVHASW